jgi:hypothetical protein
MINLNPMKLKLCLLIPILLIFGTACQSDYQDQSHTVQVANRYQVSLPSFLKKTDKLNDEASLQYMSAFREFYCLVIDEPKDSFDDALSYYDLNDQYSNNFDAYIEILSSSTLENVFLQGKTPLQADTINSLPVFLVEVDTYIDDLAVYYYGAIIEGKDHYYQLYTWTLANRKSKYKEQMKDIVFSFTEI